MNPITEVKKRTRKNYRPMKDPRVELAQYGQVVYKVEAVALAQGLSLNELARQALMNPAVLKDAAHGIKDPSLKQLARVSAILKVQPGDLLEFIPPANEKAPETL
jgi:DNA-binding Xre family transcriptional regulator